jgi:hypothetical protein
MHPVGISALCCRVERAFVDRQDRAESVDHSATVPMNPSGTSTAWSVHSRGA